MADPNTPMNAATSTGNSLFNVNEIVENAGQWLLTSGLQIVLILILTLVAIDCLAGYSKTIKVISKFRSAPIRSSPSHATC